MNAEITFSNLYWNDSLRDFFFRKQAEDTFNDVMQLFVNSPETERMVGEFFETQFSDVDEMEDYLYNTPDDEIIEEMKEFGIPCDYED